MKQTVVKNEEQLQSLSKAVSKKSTSATDSSKLRTDVKGRSARSAAKATAAVRSSLASVEQQIPQPIVYEGIGSKPAPKELTPELSQVTSVACQHQPVPHNSNVASVQQGHTHTSMQPQVSLGSVLSLGSMHSSQGQDNPSAKVDNASSCPLYLAKLPSWQVSGVIYSDNSHIVAGLNAKSSQWIRPYRTHGAASTEPTKPTELTKLTEPTVQTKPTEHSRDSQSKLDAPNRGSLANACCEGMHSGSSYEHRGNEESSCACSLGVLASSEGFFGDTSSLNLKRPQISSVQSNTQAQQGLSEQDRSNLLEVSSFNLEKSKSVNSGQMGQLGQSGQLRQVSSSKIRSDRLESTILDNSSGDESESGRSQSIAVPVLNSVLKEQGQGHASVIQTEQTHLATQSAGQEGIALDANVLGSEIPSSASVCGCVHDGEERAQEQVVYCPVEMSLSLLGGKYKSLILWKLLECGTLRFQQLRRLIPKATPKILTQQLRELEEHGLVRRTVYPVVPPKVEYSLTELGITIQPLLEAMYNWGAQYLKHLGHNANCSMTKASLVMPKIEARLQTDCSSNQAKVSTDQTKFSQEKQE